MPPPRLLSTFDLETVADFDAVAEDWETLAERAGNPFATLPWCVAWWRAYGAGRSLAIVRVRTADGRVAAVLPLYRVGRGPFALLRFIGHGPADRLGPVCAPADEELAAAALRRLVARPGELLLAERLPNDGAVRASLDGRTLRHESSPVLATAGRTWEAWLAERSANFRQQTRRYERRLTSSHDLVFRLADDPDRLDEDLGTLISLHDRRWAPAGGTTSFAGARRGFHEDVARQAQRRGWLRLWLAEIDGQAVAAWYGLRFGNRDWYYQLGRDPAWDEHRVGFVLLVHTIRDAFRAEVDWYEFGLGDEPYKARFASGDPGLETTVVGSRPAETAVMSMLRGLERLPDGLGAAIRHRVR